MAPTSVGSSRLRRNSETARLRAIRIARRKRPLPLSVQRFRSSCALLVPDEAGVTRARALAVAGKPTAGRSPGAPSSAPRCRSSSS
jgi:hypothetical protein